MSALRPSSLFDRLTLLEAEEMACIAEIYSLQQEEKQLEAQLKKADKQLRYYENYLSEVAKGVRGGGKGLKVLLDRLRSGP
jgi:predicted nuclease with TOPRIM domain